jgi:hypothetical protein
MKTAFRLTVPALLVVAAVSPLSTAFGFEGRINTTLTRGLDIQTFLYTVSSNALRIERGETNWPYAVDIVELTTGETTLLFPHNRSFVKIKPAGQNEPAPPPGFFPAMPSVVPGLGQQTQIPSTPGLPARIGPTNLPAGAPPIPQIPQIPPMPRMPAVMDEGMSGRMPAMPMMMPPMGMTKLELKSTGEKTNLLGFACEKYELRQRTEVIDIWATDQLVPFQPWLAVQLHRSVEGSMEERLAGLLKAKNLFPLRAILKIESSATQDGRPCSATGAERMRFEVKSIALGGLEATNALFQPPSDYHEVAPLPF